MSRHVTRTASGSAKLLPLLALAVLVLLGGTAHSGTTEQVTLTVEGMYCPNCERTVESVLTSVEGVVSAEADRTSQQAHVSYDPARTAPAELAEAINTQTYYQASVAGGNQRAGSPGRTGQDETGDSTGGSMLTNALLVGGLLAAAAAGTWLLVRRARQTTSRK
jgi:copper chaperone CopZ